MPRLSVCADVQKVDRSKLAQVEFSIIEFDSDTFRLLLDYLHTGSCPLTCNNIPGLICAAEHYDLPELLQACFHHAKQFLRIEVVNNPSLARIGLRQMLSRSFLSIVLSDDSQFVNQFLLTIL